LSDFSLSFQQKSLNLSQSIGKHSAREAIFFISFLSNHVNFWFYSGDLDLHDRLTIFSAMSSSVGQLESAALKRKERLEKLRAAKKSKTEGGQDSQQGELPK